jgi:hypothetical protein
VGRESIKTRLTLLCSPVLKVDVFVGGGVGLVDCARHLETFFEIGLGAQHAKASTCGAKSILEAKNLTSSHRHHSTSSHIPFIAASTPVSHLDPASEEHQQE